MSPETLFSMPSWWFAEEQLFAIVVVVRGLNLNLNLNIFSGADQIFEMLIEQTGGSCQLFKDGWCRGVAIGMCLEGQLGDSMYTVFQGRAQAR